MTKDTDFKTWATVCVMYAKNKQGDESEVAKGIKFSKGSWETCILMKYI